jgi:hypothetical protein
MAAAALSSKAIADVQVVYRVSSSSPAQSDSAREGSSHVPSKSAAMMVMAQVRSGQVRSGILLGQSLGP